MRYLMILSLCTLPAGVVAETTNGIGFNGIGMNGIGFNGIKTAEVFEQGPDEASEVHAAVKDFEIIKFIQKVSQSSLVSLNAEVKDQTVLD